MNFPTVLSDVSKNVLLSWSARAQSMLRAGDYEAVEDLCAQRLQSTPRDVEALQLLGVALMARGNAADAVRVLTSALSMEPNNTDLWFNLGQALLRLPEPEASRALEAFRRALQLDPDNIHARSMIEMMERASAGLPPLSVATDFDQAVAPAS